MKDNIEFSFELLNVYREGKAKKGNSFVEFCKKELEFQNLEEVTKKNHRVFIKALEEFRPKYHVEDIS